LLESSTKQEERAPTISNTNRNSMEGKLEPALYFSTEIDEYEQIVENSRLKQLAQN
jgi:hypothetical protein